MVKNKTSSPLDAHIQKLHQADSRFEESLMDIPALKWIKTYTKQLFYGLLLLILLTIFLYRFLATQQVKAEDNYFSLEQSAAVLNDPESTFDKKESAILEMKNLLTQYPQLQAKYDGLIAEQLLINKQVEEARPFIKRTFSRVEHETSPFFIDYAKTSILMSEGNQTKALENAYALREEMLNNPESGDGVLYAFNLIRIALLEKTAQNKERELVYWNELKNMSNSNNPIKISVQDLQRVMTHFDNGGAKLTRYIN